MAAMVRDGKISPAELLDAHLRQIKAVNSKINAFVEVLGHGLEEEPGSLPPGPLHGVPVTVKDSFDVAGLPTLCGSKLRMGHRAERDAAAVARLRAAGAVILGKTNCPENLNNYETDNFVTGRTNNPFDPDRTAGGSSGGEAAAIAAFCSPGGIGSDGGGSIREPAHFCGIAGLKPTPGRVSAAGHTPVIAHPGGLLGVAGPMARNAADLKLLFQVLAGPDVEDPFAAPVPLRVPDLSGVKARVWTRFDGGEIDPELLAAVDEAASLLEQIGIPTEAAEPDCIPQARELWWFFFERIYARTARALIVGREEDVHWTATDLIYRALQEPPPTVEQVVLNLASRDEMRIRLLRTMKTHPLILTPVCSSTAFPHQAPRRGEVDVVNAMTPLTVFNLFGMPAIVIPWKVSSEGLPIGIQIAGRPYDEELLLEVAERLEKEKS
ncbi:MAG: amidase [Acidobacteriota bacterium]|nr:amidase [Acidobacteriota bacterium]